MNGERSMYSIFYALIAERKRLGLPVRHGPCTCGNSVKGLSCVSNCGSLEKPNKCAVKPYKEKQ